MAVGPGKYDELAEYCIRKADADAVVVIVFNGSMGSGMSGKERTVDYEIAMRAGGILAKKLPAALRAVARTIEEAPPEAYVVPGA